jgi:hypothetical protein
VPSLKTRRQRVQAAAGVAVSSPTVRAATSRGGSGG